MFSFLKNFCQKNSFLFSIQQETFFYFYFFNLIFPANMDLQALPLTARGWEEASPQAKSFWSISFIGILESSSQEERSHCQRHNTRPKWPFNLTKRDSSYVHRYRVHRRGLPRLFFNGQAAALAAVVGAGERASRYWLQCGGGESHQVFKFIGHAADMIKSEWVQILAEPQGPVTTWGIIRTLGIVRTLEMQHKQRTSLLHWFKMHTCIRTHTHRTNEYKARL